MRGVAAIPNAVVQSGAAALPELDRLGGEAIAAPMRRARHRALTFTETRRRLRETRLQLRSIGDHGALRGRPRAQARGVRTTREVCVRLLRGDFPDRALDAHLTLELDPEEEQRCPRVVRECGAFRALVVGVEDEPGAVESLEE